MTMKTPKVSKKSASADSDETIFGVRYGRNTSDTSYGSLFSKTPSQKTQRSESDDSMQILDEKRTKHKKSVTDTDSLIGKSNNDGSIISESQATGSTIDDGEIVGESIGRKLRTRRKKRDPDFHYP